MPEAPNPQPKPLKSTLNLPQTAFPMKANLPVNEPLRLKQWQDSDLYGQIRRARAGSPRYLLHDGPPYANGAIHLGHALNKGLKDFIVKSKTMAGFDAPYVPGCDCHGLPIEIKVEEQLGRKRLELPATAIMQACRAYAQKYVDLQISQFVRLGVFGRWDKPYKTMARDYEARTLEAFYGFLQKGFVYRGLKPVYWCIHDRTTLAEAEVEYEQHTSPSVYVRYKLTSDAATIFGSSTEPGAPSSRQHLGAKVGEPPPNPIFTIIWTTTPWTLPASLAVAFHPEMEYVALATSDATYIVAASLAAEVIAACNLTGAREVARFPGTALDRTTFAHPFLDRSILGVSATYVTADQGTGAVHTAPAHGVDDFATGQRYGLPEVQYTDDSGRQIGTERFGGGQPQPYEGLTVFKSNPVIVELLKEKGALLAISHMEHSYPHCWRCHNPVITRATEQWFIGMDTPMPAPSSSEGVILSEAQNLSRSSEAPQAPAPITTLRQLAIEEIDKVVWDPAWGKVRITNMIATRPDWCISRQKVWDVPIAVFLCEQCNRPIVSQELNRAVVALIERDGIEAWRTPAADALLPAGSVCAHCGGTAFRKETDILDVLDRRRRQLVCRLRGRSRSEVCLHRFSGPRRRSRSVPGGRRPVSRLVPLLAAHLGGLARPRALLSRGDQRLDARRAGPRSLQVPRQLHRSRRHHGLPRRRHRPPLGRLRQLPRGRSRQSAPAPPPRRRNLPQAAQHLPFPPRRAQRDRPGYRQSPRLRPATLG